MKIETKGSLWVATMWNGCYSDRNEWTKVVHGNDFDEALNALKCYLTSGEFDAYNVFGIVVCDAVSGEEIERYQFASVRETFGDRYEMDWDPSTGVAMAVTVTRLKVVYADELAPPSKHLA